MTAQQCVAHPWLHKRPPIVQEKKKEEPQIHKVIENKKLPPDELDVAKDNLRLFVERWSEHPNSPYVFDVSTHEIMPCLSRNNFYNMDATSERSVGGCSPSPCASIGSLTDFLPGNENFSADKQPRNDSEDNVYSLRNLERRASDSSCFLNIKTDICRKVNLAEEIKKLSDRLYMLSTINTDLVNNDVQNIKTESFKYTENTDLDKTTDTMNTNIVNNKSQTSSQTGSYMEKTISSSTVNYNEKMKSEFKNNSKETVSTCPKIKNGFTNLDRAASFNTSYLNKSDPNNNPVYSKTDLMDDESGSFSNIPWARRKFKISNCSRDVPIAPERKKSEFSIEFNKRRELIDTFANSNAANSSENASKSSEKRYYKKFNENGDVKTNANNTKDLLLHLLDQWGESKNPPTDCHAGRHKSVSMEWSESESIASKSMNSLNTFFKTQSSGSTVRKKLETFNSNTLK